jgi:hypothetical protein
MMLMAISEGELAKILREQFHQESEEANALAEYVNYLSEQFDEDLVVDPMEWIENYFVYPSKKEAEADGFTKVSILYKASNGWIVYDAG